MSQLTPELVRAETDYRAERARASFPGRRLVRSRTTSLRARARRARDDRRR